MSIIPGTAASNDRLQPKGPPQGRGILKTLFARFYGKPLRDVVPSGINRRANLAGQKPAPIPKVIRRGKLRP